MEPLNFSKREYRLFPVYLLSWGTEGRREVGVTDRAKQGSSQRCVGGQTGTHSSGHTLQKSLGGPRGSGLSQGTSDDPRKRRTTHLCPWHLARAFQTSTGDLYLRTIFCVSMYRLGGGGTETQQDHTMALACTHTHFGLRFQQNCCYNFLP